MPPHDFHHSPSRDEVSYRGASRLIILQGNVWNPTVQSQQFILGILLIQHQIPIQEKDISVFPII